MTQLAALQRNIDQAQEEHHQQLEALRSEEGTKLNTLFAQRTSLLQEKGPKRFWSMVILCHPDVESELLGPYDEEILRNLLDFNVLFTQRGGWRVQLTFARNEYFEDEKLWAELNSEEDSLTFSGVRWREGKGPLDDDDDRSDEKTDKSSDPPLRQVGDKASREDTNKYPLGRGPSLFELFEALIHPENLSTFGEDEDNELNDDDFQEAVAEYEESVGDRREVLDMFVEEIWRDPASVLANMVTSDSALQ